jgi:radical SAM superfamily enzyme YgiQ (UPF0313 family)
VRVTLVTPPSPFLLDERVFMSLGVLKVAAMLEEAKIPVSVLDLSGVERFEEVTSDYVASHPADVYGITATSPQMPAAMKICQCLRATAPHSRVILGGTHVTLVSAAKKLEAKQGRSGRATRALHELMETFDTLVMGDGELAVFHALDGDSPKIVDADDPASPMFLKPERLGHLPFPARHLVDVPSYKYTIDGERALSLIGQLGCPFACSYCGGRFSPFLRRMRLRPPENIVEEMEQMYRAYGNKGFMFLDDEVNISTSFVDLLHKIRDLQDRLGVEFRMRAFVKSERFTEEQAKLMYSAGYRWILVGFESGDDRILINMNKKATRDDNTRCIEIAHRHGLKVKALMSIGHAGESAESVGETEKWLLQVAPDDFDCTVITTYPGTPYFDESLESSPGVWTYTQPKTGDRLHATEIDFHRNSSYYKGIPGAYTANTWTDFLTSEALVSLRDTVEDRVRSVLGIPYPSGAAPKAFEHSMGQHEALL